MPPGELEGRALVMLALHERAKFGHGAKILLAESEDVVAVEDIVSRLEVGVVEVGDVDLDPGVERRAADVDVRWEVPAKMTPVQ